MVEKHEKKASPPSYGSYYFDLYVAWVIRGLFFATLMVLVAMFVAGCSRGEPPLELGDAARRSISNDGSSTETRNNLPYGGDYEKSDCAPRRPMD